MLNNKKAFIYVLLIMLLWITGSQEMYINKEVLTDAVALRYLIYFVWLFITALIGYVALRKESLIWPKQAWLAAYAFVFLVLLLLGVIDLFVLHFSLAQKAYIQTFRLFFQSPVPLVIMHLVTKRLPIKNTIIQRSTIPL